MRFRTVRVLVLAIFLCLFIVCFPRPAEAANQKDVKTLVEGRMEKTFTVVPEVKLSSVDGRFAAFAGLHGGVLLNHKFLIGVGGYGLTNQPHIPVGYGGLVLQYLPWSDRVIHVSFGGLVGGGGLHAMSFFVAEPEVRLNLNITKWFRLGAAGGYRMVTGAGYANSSLRGPVATISVGFGT